MYGMAKKMETMELLVKTCMCFIFSHVVKRSTTFIPQTTFSYYSSALRLHNQFHFKN